jgi:hypothetical protein
MADRRPDLEAARTAVAARLGYDPSGPASRNRSRWWETPWKTKLAAARGLLPSGRGRPRLQNTWSDETIALAVSDALVFGALDPYRNRATEGRHSACSLVAEMLRHAPQPLHIDERAIEKIWARLGPALPHTPNDLSGWR